MQENIKKKATIFYKTTAGLGEGPLWMVDSNELIWVDITKGFVHATNVSTKEDKIIYRGENPSCIVPITTTEFLISDRDKIIKLDTITLKSTICIHMCFETTNIRFNDGKIDPNGNFWVGTMDKDATPNKGSLYRIDSKKNISEVLKGITISNGLTWSLDSKTMYYIDTFENAVYAFDFNPNSEISNQKIVLDIPKELGAPDGMTIDNRGNLWIAMWGGFSVICWNPESGKIVDKIEVDVQNVTSCAFGGEDMTTLFITTAREGMSCNELKKQPNSGSVFHVKTKVSGVKLNNCKI